MKPALLRLLAVAVVLTGAAWAQEDEAQGRGVARISVIDGDVSVRRGDTGDWVAAALNAPLVAEDRLGTGTASRAEVQLDWSNMIRVASSSEIRLSELEYHRYQVQVARGLVTFRVLRDIEAQVEICTPSISMRPLKKGVYRIEVREDGTSEIIVRSGEAEIFTPRGSEKLSEGHSMLVRGSASDPEFQTASAPQRDDWDGWNVQRDQDLERSESYKYVSSDINGAEDLDNHGSWINDDSYGHVWSPRVDVDWAPYRNGRWVWVDWYGWSWVSYDPWGWAPYHYGRWFNRPGHGWCWWPGAYGAHNRHYWSPGLVAFFGWGSHGGAHGGFGHVGWVPLGPHESYHRWYGGDQYRGYRGGRIDHGAHIVNNVDIARNYRNARVRNGMTGINADGFTRGRREGMVSIGERDVRGARLVRGVMPVSPGRASLRMADREGRPGAATRGSSNDRFFSTRQASRVDRVSFEDQRRGVERIATRSGFGGGMGVAGRRLDRGAVAATPTGSLDRGGWRKAETVDRGGDANRVNRSGGENNGWRRFGAPSRAGDAGGGTQSVYRGGSGSRSGEGNWRRYDGGAGNSTVERVPRGSGRESYPQNRSGAWRGDSSRWGSPRSERSSEGSVRISPPIVRERPSGGSVQRSSEARSAGGGGPSRSSGSGGGGSSRSGGSGGGGGNRGGGRGR